MSDVWQWWMTAMADLKRRPRVAQPDDAKRAAELAEWRRTWGLPP